MLRIVPASRFVLAAIAILAASGARADCKKVSGRVTFDVVSGPACTSTVGLCATGFLEKGLKGTWDFTATSLVQTVDTPTTGVLIVTADETFGTPDGDILLKAAMAFRSIAPGEIASVDVVVGGTAAWAGASGVLVTTGFFDPAAGGSATIKGEICTP